MHGKASSLDLNEDAVWLVTDLGQIWATFKNVYFYYLKLSCSWKFYSGIRKHGLYLVNGNHSWRLSSMAHDNYIITKKSLV